MNMIYHQLFIVVVHGRGALYTKPAKLYELFCQYINPFTYLLAAADSLIWFCYQRQLLKLSDLKCVRWG